MSGKLTLKNGIIVPARMFIQTKSSKELSILDKAIRGDEISVAIVRSSGGIGDVLMTFPVVKALKKKYNCKLTYVTTYGYLGGALQKVAQHNPYIDNVLDFAHYKEINYDININLTCPCVAHEVPKALPIHRIDLFARYCGITLEDKKIDYIVTQDESNWATSWYEERNLDPKNCIILQPYASNVRRSYDIKNLQRAILQCVEQNPKMKFVLIRHSSDWDKDTGWDLRNVCHAKDFDITSIAALTEQANMVLCQDSAILHLAGALDKKIVGLFGPTDYRARMYPKMKALCPGEQLACWPIWYAGTIAQVIETWRLLTPNMISSAVTEMFSVSDNTYSRINVEEI